MLLVRKSLAEAIGTFAIVFFGCGMIRVMESQSVNMGPLAVPIVFGITVMTMIFALGHVSGAHFNPAVTLAFAVARHFPIREVFAYWIAQFGGALLAVGILAVLIPTAHSFGSTTFSVPVLQALGWEVVLGFFLMLVIIAVATDTRAVGLLAGPAIGAVVTLGALVGGSVTGASMNPARSLGPAIAEGRLDLLWVYFVGPSIGAVLAAVLYEWLRCDQVSTEPSNSNRKSAKGCC